MISVVREANTWTGSPVGLKGRYENKWGQENAILSLFELGIKEDILGRTIFVLDGGNLQGFVQMRMETDQGDTVWISSLERNTGGF